MATSITVEIKVNLPIEKTWETWNSPADIMQWNAPSEDWHSPRVETDLKEGGRFLFRMEAKDGTEGFDHAGIYDRIITNQLIEYIVADGRKSIIQFIPDGSTTTIRETFEPETTMPVDMQRDFCQAILKHFKKHAESNID